MIKVALVGGRGGIGAALLSHLRSCANIDSIYTTYYQSSGKDSSELSPLVAAGSSEPNLLSASTTTGIGASVQVHWSRVDITDEVSVKQWITHIGEFDWLINCAGFLHDANTKPEKSIAQLNPYDFHKSMNINCLGSLLLAKYAASALKQSDRGIFAAITAKVGSIEDNRLGGWYSYRAAKAAANMVLKNLSIEWQRTAPNVRVVALHPGTTDTKLSKPYQARIKAEKLFSPEMVAALLVAQLEQLHDFPSGRFIAYDGEELPW